MGRAQLRGDHLRRIEQHGRLVVEECLLGRDRGAVRAGIGIDLPDHDIARGEAGPQRAERGGGLQGA